MSSLNLIRGRVGSHVGRSGVDNICPSWPRWGDLEESNPLDILIIIAWLLQMLGLIGFHTLQNRNYGRIGRGLLYVYSGAPTQALGLLLVLARSETLGELLIGVGGEHIGRVGFVWCRYFASQGTAALVRHSAHRIPARHDTLGPRA
jgi:hypothetical protein